MARVLPLVFGALAALPAAAQSTPRPEQLIKWRQSAYQTIAWNSTRLKNALAAGTYDATEVRGAANALAAIAASGLPSLFAAGTEKGKGWRETTAAAAAFSDAAKFRQLTEEFARDAGQLAKLAAGTEAKAVREQFLKVAQSCKGCHNQFRQTE
ncbi:MAG TPA: cytochrome c [Steroidobacteraceae bacterium]|nr:cytochrome c [Steroidobacteraceae bacterium]